jgi:hypothetical protein
MAKSYIITELEYDEWDDNLFGQHIPNMVQYYFNSAYDLAKHAIALPNVSVPIQVELTKDKEKFFLEFYIANAELKKFINGTINASDLSENALKSAKDTTTNKQLKFILSEEKIIELNTAIHEGNEATSKQELAKKAKALEAKLKREAVRKIKMEEELKILKGSL